MLRLPELLLRAPGTLTPLDDGPEGVVLGSTWSLEAVCAGVLLPVAGEDDLCPVTSVDDLPPAAGVDDLRPAVGVGDLRPAPTRGGTTNDPYVSLFSPSVPGKSSSPAPQ